MTPEIVFRRKVVEPINCISAAWAMVKEQYWLFVGMCAVGLLIGGAVPLGILTGPMMCGLYLSFFNARRGRPIEFGTLFKGFDYFGPSLVATLLHMAPILIIIIPAYLFFYLSMIFSMGVAAQSGDNAAAAAAGVMGFFILFWIAMMIIIIFISIGFTFTYPLIVDRKLGALDAIKWSFKAALGNFWRLLGMYLLTGLMAIGGIVLCYVGVFLVFPIMYGAIAIAYERVFGLSEEDVAVNLPPPPPSFNY
ncbi:MAG TPA: DUF975 family protein [Pyrinomonadaceae bacterium]